MIPRRLLVPLAALAATVLLSASAWSLLRSHSADRDRWLDRETARVSAAVDAHLSRHAEVLDAVVERLNEMGAEDDRDPAVVLQAALSGASHVPGAVLEVFRAPAERIARVTPEGGPGSAPPLPASVQVASFAADEDEDESEDLVWFSTSQDGLYFHRVFQHLGEELEHEEEHEDEDDEDDEDERDDEEDDERFEDVLLLHLATPVRAPAGTRLVARCDMQDGRFTESLPAAAAAASLSADAVDPSAIVLDVDAVAGRHPTPSEAPRLVAYVTGRPGLAVLPLTLALLGAAGLVFLTVAWARQAPAPSRAAPDLTGEAAHEMRTPLTVMRGKLEVALRRERTPEHYRRTLRECLDEVDGLEHLHDAVLLLTRTERNEIGREPVDLRALVRAEARRIQELHPEREISLRAPRDGNATVHGDPSLLARAVGNLLDNAAGHSISGGAIRIRVESAEGFIQVVVEDDGPGIPPERHDLVFERFFRGPDVGRRGIAGCGLGLPIVRRIARLHGGGVRIDPTVHGRSRFVLRLGHATP